MTTTIVEDRELRFLNLHIDHRLCCGHVYNVHESQVLLSSTSKRGSDQHRDQPPTNEF